MVSSARGSAMSRAMSYYCRILNASFWLYLWLWDYCGPYLTEADFYPTLKGDFLRLLSNLIIPAICLVIDWGLRRVTNRGATTSPISN
jgi:hypothetical protein